MASQVFQRRNLVVLGRTGVGKSTVVNQILGKTIFPVSSALESTTRETRTLEEVVVDEERKVEYKIKIIDTVGLKNKVVKSKDIMKDITDYYSTQQVTEEVHLILFVIRKEILEEEEKQAFDQIIANYKNKIQGISALVITGCEALADDGQEELIQEMQHRQDTKTFSQFMGKGIYPVGFPSVDNLIPAIKKMYEEKVKTGAEMLRRAVMGPEVMTLRQDTIHKEICDYRKQKIQETGGMIMFQKRNLLVLGRTGVGKSTVVNQILGKTIFPVSSAGKNRKLEEEFVDEQRKIKYKIKIIDTVDQYNQVVRGEEIIEDLNNYSSQRVPEGVSLILFVIRYRHFSKEEKDVFDCIIATFKNEIKDISALVITGCEGLDDNGRQEVFQEIKWRHDSQTFAEFMGKGIYPVGFESQNPPTAASRDMHEEGIKTDAELLRKVVMDSGVMTLNQDIFCKKMLPLTKSNQLLQSFFSHCVLL